MQKVPVTVDGKTHQVHAMLHTFAGLLGELQLTRRTMELAGEDEVIGLRLTSPRHPSQPAEVRGNQGIRINGNEVFESIRQPFTAAA